MSRLLSYFCNNAIWGFPRGLLQADKSCKNRMFILLNNLCAATSSVHYPWDVPYLSWVSDPFSHIVNLPIFYPKYRLKYTVESLLESKNILMVEYLLFGCLRNKHLFRMLLFCNWILITNSIFRRYSIYPYEWKKVTSINVLLPQLVYLPYRVYPGKICIFC